MSTNAEAPAAALDLQRTGISHIAFKTKRKFASVALFIVDGQNTQLKVKSHSTSQIAFHLPKALTLEPQQSIRLTYRHWYWGMRSRTIEIAIQEILQTYVPGGEEKQKWSRLYGKSCELVVELERTQERKHTSRRNSLSPITDQILEVCPRFRILVIGKTGAGKSSLINKTFGVNEANVSHKNPGKANIETEIISESNPQFVLHDSLGFEHGEGDHLSVVEKFIQRLDGESELRKKLHAIWICLEIPILGGRLLETGVESFLKMKADGKLGDVPVILVFTKYDVLVDSIKKDMYDNDPRSTTLEEDAKARAETKILEECIKPLVMERKVPHIKVSTSEESGYEQTLQDLIQVTFDTVFFYLEDASVVTAMAQKVNPGVKIRAVIGVGKRKYWTGLGSSLNFPSYTLERCLNVIHTDIIRVWNFTDPDDWLLSQEFKALITNGVDYKTEGKSKTDGKSNTTLSLGLSMMAALATIISVLSGPAAPIVIPIAGAFVFAAWAREVYTQSQRTLCRLMTYIIDLTLVTQNLFWIQSMLGSNQTPVTRRMIKLAFVLHIHSKERNKLIVKIHEYSKNPKAVMLGGADTTFEKIEELIMSSLINYPEMIKQDRQILDGLADQRDEDWILGQKSTNLVTKD